MIKVNKLPRQIIDQMLFDQSYFQCIGTIEDILAENIIHRIAPCKHCPKTFIEIFTPYTFSEKASPFLSS